MSPVFRERGHHPSPQGDPIRMVLDDEVVDRLRIAAVRYGMDVEELMGALLHVAAGRIDELLGGPPARSHLR
jgi:hypothetical protein